MNTPKHTWASAATLGLASLGNSLISKSNTKIGETWSFSLPPGGPYCYKGCRKSCYAYHLGLFRPSLVGAWSRNLLLYQSDANLVFQALRETLRTYTGPVRHFRWHVSGDLVNSDYAEQVRRLATDLPDWKFLMLTKRLPVFLEGLPKHWDYSEYRRNYPNLQVIWSRWPGDKPLRPPRLRTWPQAWIKPRAPVSESRIPTNSRVCPGACESCGRECWHLKAGENVVFKQH